jgi:predicted nucleic acid-binding protein
MKYVVDCSVAFKWVVAETDSQKALNLRDGFCNGLIELLAPDNFVTEIAQALVVAERRSRISPGESTKLLADILNTLPDLHPGLPDILPRAQALAIGSVASVYDCLYVALAERENCDLVTADTRLVNNLQQRFPFIKDLSTFP